MATTTTPPTLAERIEANADDLSSRLSQSTREAALSNLRWAADELAAAERNKHVLISMAHSVGCSLRDIANAVDMSPAGVSKLLQRINS